MLYTSLYKNHKNFDAKLVEFNGFMMPLNYKDGIVSEVISVRKNVGMFDVSHMGRIIIGGKDSKKIISKFLSIDLDDFDIGKSKYTIFLNKGCQIVDDLIISNLDGNTFLLVVNASNRSKVIKTISSNIDFL